MKPIFQIMPLSLFACMQLACAQSIAPASLRTIEVSGSHRIQIDPDEVTLSLAIQEYWKEEFEGKKYEEYRTKIEITDIERELISALQDLGVKMEQITLIQSGNYWRSTGKDILVNKNLSIKFNSVEEINTLSNKLKVRGIQNMYISELKHKDLEKYQLETKAQALKNAREKALHLVRSMGYELGEAITIVEIDQNVGRIPRSEAYGRVAMMNEAKVAPDVEYENFRKITINEELRVVFSIR